MALGLDSWGDVGSLNVDNTGLAFPGQPSLRAWEQLWPAICITRPCAPVGENPIDRRLLPVYLIHHHAHAITYRGADTSMRLNTILPSALLWRGTDVPHEERTIDDRFFRPLVRQPRRGRFEVCDSTRNRNPAMGRFRRP